MSDDKNLGQGPENQTPEEVEAAKVAEAKALEELSDDDVQAQVIEQYGLDADVDSDLIGKLVADKKDTHKTLGVAIKQKQGWRDKASKPAEVKPDEEKPTGPTGPAPLTDESLNERLDARDLDATDLSDELKDEVKKYAKVNECSIREAQDSDYLKYLIGEAEKKARIEGASIDGTKKTQPSISNFSDKGPGDFDLDTEEGRSAWEDYKVWLKTQ